MEFNNLEDLYKRIMPALKTKKADMRRKGYSYIEVEDIWNYLKEVKWRSAKNLLLYEMANDVLNVDEVEIDNYLKQKLKLTNRTLYFEEE